MDIIYDVHLHHGGIFKTSNLGDLQYIDGKKKRAKVDSDLLSYFEIVGLVKDEGYTSMHKLYYCSPGMSLSTGLKLVTSDSDIQLMLAEYGNNTTIEIYVDHLLDEALNGIWHPENPSNEYEASPALNLDSHSEVENAEISDNDENPHGLVYHDESETESDVNSLDFVSDDEELVQVRKKKQQMNSQTGPPECTIPTFGLPPPVMSLGKEQNTEIHEITGKNKFVAFTHTEDIQTYETTSTIPDFQEPDYDSCNYDTQESEIDEDNLHRQKRIVEPKYLTFDPKTAPENQEATKGMKFADCAQLKSCLTNYAVRRGYPIKFKRSLKKKLIVKCADGCPWRLSASWMQKEKTFQVKSLENIHKCSRSFRIKLVTSKWLAMIYGTKIRKNPAWKLKDIVEDVREKYNVLVTLCQCYRAKKRALGEIEQELIAHYAKLRNYAAMILISNPGSTVKIQTQRTVPTDPAYFQRFYVCFDNVKKGWIAGCRPILGFDGCFLKSYCCGELLVAVGRDANNQMYPLAWAVVEVENTESWKWFIGLIMEDIGCYRLGTGLTVITDQQKGLKNAIAEVIPYAEHRNCARHIYSNMRKRASGAALKAMFWQAAKSSTPEEFNVVAAEIKKQSLVAYNYLNEQNPKVWSKAFFQTTSKCDAVENNMCECFNGTIVEARYKNIIDMLEDIRIAVRDRMLFRMNLINQWEGPLCPKIKKIIEENKLYHRFWSSAFCGEDKFEVKMGVVGYAVDVSARTCTCRMWQLNGIPCCHAISAIYYLKEDPYNYVSESYKVEVCKKAYNNLMQPMNGEALWPQDPCDKVLPPPHRRMPGRPQKNRQKSATEEHKMSTAQGPEISRKGRQMMCHNCRQYGHNKSSCKNPYVAPPPKGKWYPRKNLPAVTTQGGTTQGGATTQPASQPVTQPAASTRLANTTKQPPKKRLKKDKVPQGYGLYVAESGNAYYRGIGQGRPVQINSQSGAAAKKTQPRVKSASQPAKGKIVTTTHTSG